ncbi:MAG: hypothetical protein QM607_11175 [Microbacterium sp.]
MKLEFFFVPTGDLDGTLSFYREAFGATELWREGDSTAAISLPGADVSLMLDTDQNATPGPVFAVDSVKAVADAFPDDVTCFEGPAAIPGGFWGGFHDPAGAAFYLVDQSTEAA